MSSGHEALARKLDAEKDRVLRLWEERARRSIPAARRPDRLMLLDGLPAMLEEMVEELADEPLANGDRVSENASGHGRQRASVTDYSLDQMIAEYDLLRHALFEVLEAPAQPLAVADREALLERLESRVRAAATEFSKVREQERERTRAELAAANESLERRVKERTAELLHSEALFRGLVEGVKDYAIFTVDPSGVVTTWNAGAERMNGYTAKEIIGRHFQVLYPHEGVLRDEPMAHLRTAQNEGRFRGEGMRVRKNGDPYLADVLITPMFDGDQLTGFSKVVQDLTERNLLMQERDLLKSDADRLRVEAEYRERFVASLSHDLRSPLSAARAGAQLIARAPEKPDKVRHWALRISVAIERADRMIVDLLDASRLDAGQPLSLELEKCDLCLIANDVIGDAAGRYGDRFVLECPAHVEGHWDADALWRVLENLLTNAVKYGSPGAPITVRIRPMEDRVLLAVHNQGTVIPVTEQAKLFQPYHRTDVAQAGGAKGWGLGLALVRGIVEAHHGDVKVESYPNEGTTFTIDLPVDSRS